MSAATPSNSSTPVSTMSTPDDRRRDRRVEVGHDVRHRALDVQRPALGAPERAGGQHVGGRADHADHDHDPALDVDRVDEPLPGLPRDDAGEHEQHGAVDLRRQDLRAAEAEREVAARRARREPRRDEREADRAGVGEHVRRVGEQGERRGQDAGHDLDAP